MVAERGLPDAEAEAMSFVRADDSKTESSDCLDVILGNEAVRWKSGGLSFDSF